MAEAVISIADFKARLDAGEIEYLFDLRTPDEFDDWRIEGKVSVETLNIPQLDFVGEEDKYYDQLPKDKEIIAICAHGDASKYTAEHLQEQGYRALSLDGGMDAWAIFYETHQVNAEPAIYQIYRVAKGCITHVLISGQEAIVIDAVRHIEHIEKILKEHGVALKAVLDTHLQADHISGGRELAQKYGAEYWIHPTDAEGASYTHNHLSDEVTFSFGSCTLATIHSPGHTPGSTSFLLNNRFLFTGDTIMKKSLGRPDLGGKAGEWSHLLYETLYKRFQILSDDIVVLPTHAASLEEMDNKGLVELTMAEARKHEMYNVADEKVFAKKIEDSLLENPERYQDIRKVNLGLLEVEEKKLQELEIGKNLCGMAALKEKLGHDI